MSGVGFWELIILFLIGLIVLGPEKLPRVANQLGSWLGQARRMTRVMKRQLEDELNLEKGINLNSITNPAPKKPSVTQPQYVHDRPKKTEDLPDDFSPAHGPADSGTGVGEDGIAVASDGQEAAVEKKEDTAAPVNEDENPKKESS
jgi:sec-independent protein translocase protein TatB